jgi:hypothetical protein
MLVPLRWELRVDESGITRRWLFSWHLWSWADFASGRIEKRYPITFVDPDRRWWCRKLRLAYVAEAELRELIRLINDHYRLPAAPMLPDTLQIKYGFRRTVELDWRDIRLRVRGEPFHFTWQQVQRLHITRIDALRRDFSSLELMLPDREIELKLFTHQGVTTPTWTGATADELNDFLLAHVPADRVDIDITGERPSRVVDVEKQLISMRKNARAFRIAMLTCAFLLAALLVWMAIDVGILRALAMAGLYSLYIPIIWFVRREVHKRQERWETWLAELQDNPSRAAQLKG